MLSTTMLPIHLISLVFSYTSPATAAPTSSSEPELDRRATGPTLLPLPTLTTCRPANISWTGGQPPYTLWVFPSYVSSASFGSYLSAERFDDIPTSWFVWLADVQFEATSGVDFRVTDAQLVDSAKVHAKAVDGGDWSCVAFDGYTSEVDASYGQPTAGGGAGGAASGNDPTQTTPSQPPSSATADPPSSSPSSSPLSAANPSSPFPSSSAAGSGSSGTTGSNSSTAATPSDSGGASQTDRGTIIAAVISGVIGAVGAVVAAFVGVRCVKRRKARAE